MKYIVIFFIMSSVCADLPSWVSNSQESCKKGYLCAVGEGETRSKASRFARIALSKIFDNKITSTFSSSLSSGNGEISEDAKESVEEVTNSVLDGVEIVKTADSKIGYFVFAQLHKRKAAVNFKREIDKLDEKMKTLINQDDPALALKLESIYGERELLNRRYAFLTGRDVPSDIDFKKIFNNKKAAMNDIVVHVYLDESEPKNIELELVSGLTSLGYKVSTGRVRNKKSTHIITGKVISEKQHLNIDGFEKYNFIIEVSASDIRKVKTSAFTINTMQTGRNYNQAYEKALNQVKNEMNIKVKNLSLK